MNFSVLKLYRDSLRATYLLAGSVRLTNYFCSRYLRHTTDSSKTPSNIRIEPQRYHVSEAYTPRWILPCQSVVK